MDRNCLADSNLIKEQVESDLFCVVEETVRPGLLLEDRTHQERDKTMRNESISNEVAFARESVSNPAGNPAEWSDELEESPLEEDLDPEEWWDDWRDYARDDPFEGAECKERHRKEGYTLSLMDLHNEINQSGRVKLKRVKMHFLSALHYREQWHVYHTAKAYLRHFNRHLRHDPQDPRTATRWVKLKPYFRAWAAEHFYNKKWKQGVPGCFR